MAFRPKNNQGDAVLSISGSANKKKKIQHGPKAVRCQCSKCGQVAFAFSQTEHAFCKGFRPNNQLASLTIKLVLKNKGVWFPINI